MAISKDIQNNFIAGLKTEYTGLNYPENAATDTANCVYSLIGDVERRGGIDYEANAFVNNSISASSRAVNSYKWNNVGGDGSTQIVAVQLGATIYFYISSNATIANPLSKTSILSSVNLASFVASGGSLDATVECQFTDGNGYLFVFHPNCDPIYCTYSAGTVTANLITVQVRDFTGIPDNLPATNRPPTLSQEHLYNLINQGWASTKSNWAVSSSTSLTVGSGLLTWTTTPIGQTVSVGDVAAINAFVGRAFVNVMSGVVNSYAAGSGVLGINISYINLIYLGSTFNNWTITCNSSSNINTFQTAANAYPSNADVWWVYKNTSGLFSPSTLLGTVPVSGPAPQGSVILNAFNQQRNGVYGVEQVTSITPITTTVRPRTGCWFQGRVWYSGVDGSQAATGDAPFTTWTENIYFSQIATGTEDFGLCYQTNDPTSQTTFDLLPSDGGIIVIQGSGPIYKLFPVQNGLLVFAANGIWFITGSTGIGFAANDYTITKVSGVQSIWGTSFVNVLGWPYFWNAEGIYAVMPAQAGLQVENLTLGTILTYYQNIPLISKQYARGDYDPINYQLQWCFRSTSEAGISNRYSYDTILVHNSVEIRQGVGKAFYPYTISTGTATNSKTYPHIMGIRFVQGPGGSTNSLPLFKYLVSSVDGVTFAEEKDFTRYFDWFSFDSIGKDYTSYFLAGYNLKPQLHPYFGMYSQAYTRFSPSFLVMFIRNPTYAYKVNTLWDFSSSGSSGKWSAQQQITSKAADTNFTMVSRRHRVRGHGYSMQLKITSVSGQPFDFMGWSIWGSTQDAP
jgi:hypothetical protein